MQSKDLVLGIDTSNYTTSLALTDINGEIVINSRKLLSVKQGERGLRQSYALFQHMENIPDMMPDIFSRIDRERIGAVAAAGRPRPVKESYMPVFKAGVNYGKVMAFSFGVPFFEFSHQEGHLEAVRHESVLSNVHEYIAYHLSGGTTEMLHIDKDTCRLIGGSRDISFGQVLDRIGVGIGYDFPSGSKLDDIAVSTKDKLSDLNTSNQSNKNRGLLKRIPIDGFEINLSGLETQCQRELQNGAKPEVLIYELFCVISECICLLTEKTISEIRCSNILFAGGVSASRFVRAQIEQYFSERPVKIVFGNPALSSDNAVGISFLGGKKLWQSNR
ncbi:MAG: hypothetical protein PHV71_04540 [Eubacteriales bacterium]|nr:hypothetical protein [Eubacteriales bacterium]MDD3199534.1 hypothetical protein [Eubacteriales bacterium]MDD4629859.1 hypothetical protein [Eubacteriales bacterium]